MTNETMTLADYLAEQAAAWEKLGHPALLERFVLRNGRPFAPARRVGRRGAARQCFRNSAEFVARGRGAYVEGFAMRQAVALPIHHAWVTLDGASAMDPTLPAAEFGYFGVEFDARTTLREQGRNGCYGLLDTGAGLNHRLMFEIDPGLRRIAEAVSARRPRRNDTAQPEVAENAGSPRAGVSLPFPPSLIGPFPAPHESGGHPSEEEDLR